MKFYQPPHRTMGNRPDGLLCNAGDRVGRQNALAGVRPVRSRVPRRALIGMR